MVEFDPGQTIEVSTDVDADVVEVVATDELVVLLDEVVATELVVDEVVLVEEIVVVDEVVATEVVVDEVVLVEELVAAEVVADELVVEDVVVRRMAPHTPSTTSSPTDDLR